MARTLTNTHPDHRVTVHHADGSQTTTHQTAQDARRTQDTAFTDPTITRVIVKHPS